LKKNTWSEKKKRNELMHNIRW